MLPSTAHRAEPFNRAGGLEDWRMPGGPCAWGAGRHRSLQDYIDRAEKPADMAAWYRANAEHLARNPMKA